MDLLNKKFEAAARKIFNSPDGQVVLAKLRRDFLETSALAETAHLTYYNLGKEDLIKMFINYTKEENLDELVKTLSTGVEESNFTL